MILSLFIHHVIAQYIDPGAGSYVFQLVIAGAMGLFFLFFSKIKGLFVRFFKPGRQTDGKT